MPKVNRAMDYSISQIKTAGKLKSLQMLHEGGARFLREAKNDPANARKNIIKARNIIAQLQLALDFSSQGIAELYFYLYDYMYVRLQENDANSVNDVISLFDHLSYSFRLLGRKQKQPA